MSTQKILFSPLGGTDPISNFRDGSMLHICRVYKPDVVFLYLSKEMCEFHRKDDRYLYCIRKLSELTDHKFEVKLIERPDLANVYEFDFFYKEFESLIREIHQQYDGEILLNVSSGTPAMKNALNILSELMGMRLTPVQVVTPEGKINSHEEDRNNYDVESYWELNQDNDPETFQDRTTKIKNRNQTAVFMINNIKRLIDAFDYTAALDLAESIKEFISPEVIQLLKIACARISMDYSGYAKAGGRKYDFMPVRGRDESSIVEYILVLQIKEEKAEHADLLRAITPVFFELCKIAVQKLCDIDLSEVTYIGKKGILNWRDDLQNYNQRLYLTFEESYRDGFRGGRVETDALAKVIYRMSNNEISGNAFKEFRDIEEKVRNIAAHNLVAITDDWIKLNSGHTTKQIIKKLKALVAISGIEVTQEGWDSYLSMNKVIKDKLLLED